MALTREQFDKLRSQGLSVEQITSFEKNGKPTSTTTRSLPISSIEANPLPFKESTNAIDYFGDNLRETWRRRTENAANIEALRASGKISGLGSVAGKVGQVAGGIADTAFGFAEAATRDIRGVAKDTIHDLVPDSIEAVVAGALTPVGKSVSGGIDELSKHYGSFREQFPEAATWLEAGVNIAGLIPVGKAGQVAGKGAKAASTAIKGIEAAGDAVDATLGAKALAKVVTAPGRLAKYGFEKIGSTAAFAPALGTGMSIPDIKLTVDEFGKINPKAANRMTRDDLMDAFSKEVDKLGGDVLETSAAYKPIKEAKGFVNVPENYLKDYFTSIGFKVTDKTKKAAKQVGKASDTALLGPDGLPISAVGEMDIPQSASSRKRLEMTSKTSAAGLSNADLKDLEDIYNRFDGQMLTNEEFLNLRSKLSKVSRFDYASPKSSDMMNLARKLRYKLNEDFRKDIPGLAELDAEIEPKMQLLDELKSKFYTKDGIRDNADDILMRVRGNEKLMGKIEKVYPEIARDIHIVDVIEQWEKAISKPGAVAGAKYGALATAFLSGGVGLFPAAIAAAMSVPQVALPILRGVGMSKSMISSTLKLMGSTTNFFGNIYDDIEGAAVAGVKKVGNALSDVNQSTQPGLSMKPVVNVRSIAQNVDAEDIANMSTFLNQPTQTGSMVGTSIVPPEFVALAKQMDPTIEPTDSAIRALFQDVVDEAENIGAARQVPITSK
jgi:hypothetical protein